MSTTTLDATNVPATQPPAGRATQAPAASVQSGKKPRRAPLVFLGLALVAGTGIVGWKRLHAGLEQTDDAQIEGHLVNVASRVAGQVARVIVRDNQTVREGDVLVELDRRDLDARLAVADADVEAARAGVSNAEAALLVAERSVGATITQARGGIRQSASAVRSSRASIDQARADVDAATARRTLAETEMERIRTLHAQGAVSRAALDAQQAQYDQAAAQWSLARARLDAAQSSVEGSQGALEAARGRLVAAEAGPQQVEQARAALALARARLAQAEAARTLAQLNVSYATIRAPRGGVVSRRSVEPGQMVDPSRALMAIVPLDDVWLVANFKEDQVGTMREGQRAEFTVDAFPGRRFHAHVESLAGATGSRFSLLPPDNASGNFVKVIQRVPVLLRIDDGGAVPLRPGLSADVTVAVGR